MTVLEAKAVESEKDALLLLTQNIPKLTKQETFGYDFLGKDMWEKYRHPKKAYYCRVIAARSFERLAKEALAESLSNSKKSSEFLKHAGYSYEKAAKNIQLLHFEEAVVRCRIRACKVWHSIYQKSMNETAKEHLDYSSRDIINAINNYWS